MKLQFKHQKFQADAAKAVVDVFSGQPCFTPTYRMDRGADSAELLTDTDNDFTVWANQKLIPVLSDSLILEHIRRIRRKNQIQASDKLEGRYNLTIEMETGVVKTYTYIKTMYEVNKAYGWSKFIVVVPNVAIREGVYKSFQITQEHFAEEYGKRIRFFIYNSARLSEIDHFASDSSIHVMIINSQAFNAKDKDARRIYMKLDANTSVAVYVKLPEAFYISTPVGKYTPDWAIAFYEGDVKHIHFVVETKGSMMQLNEIENSKIHCAREHFKTISGNKVVYEVVDSYRSLLGIVTE